MRKGKYVRRIPFPGGKPVNLMHLAQHSGDLVAHSWSDCSLHAFSLNGFHLAETTLRRGQRLFAMTVTQDGQMLVAGGRAGSVQIFLVHSLEQVREGGLRRWGWGLGLGLGLASGTRGLGAGAVQIFLVHSLEQVREGGDGALRRWGLGLGWGVGVGVRNKGGRGRRCPHLLIALLPRP